MEYVNGSYNNNGTIYDGEISYEYYYDKPTGQEWATVILNVGVAAYPVRVYLVCNTEIEQNTKPDMQNLDANSWINFNEPSTNNFTLTGKYISGPDTTTYTGNIEFNSDKVLKYVYDEIIMEDGSGIVSTTRYIWTLTYTPGTGTTGDPDGIPGFSIYIILIAAAIGFLLIVSKKSYLKIKR